MTRTPSTHSISIQGRTLVAERLKALGLHVVTAAQGSRHHLVVAREASVKGRSVWVTTNLKAKPAGGGGPPALNWKIRRNVDSDLVALADLSSSRVWLMEAREAETIAQQHNSSYHHMVMVLEPGWTSTPHASIRDDQFEHLLLERRVSQLV